jgi:hypothetical protein
MLLTSISGERNDSFFISGRIRFVRFNRLCRFYKRERTGEIHFGFENVRTVFGGKFGAGLDILFFALVNKKWG